MRRQRTQKIIKLQMGIEPMNFRTLVGRSTTEQWEVIWRTMSQYCVKIRPLRPYA